jgi:GGDEF domain-containing protein
MYKLQLNQTTTTSVDERDYYSFKASIKREGIFQEVNVTLHDLFEAEISLYNYFTAPRLNTPVLMQYVCGIDDKIKYLKKLFHETYDSTSEFDAVSERNRELAEYLNTSASHLPWVLRNRVASDIGALEMKSTLPLSELKQWANKTVNYLESKYRSNDEDSYLDLFGVDYEKLLLKDCIHKSCVEATDHVDPYCVAKCTLDVNGVKMIDDYGEGGHDAGHELLRHVATILKSGRTTKFLQSLGIHVFPFVEGGDEFALLLFGRKDLRPALGFITELYLAEMEHTDVAYLLDFEKPEVQKLFQARNVKTHALDKFLLSCGFGWSVLGEVLETWDLPQESEPSDYVSSLNQLCRTMFSVADESCLKHKAFFKSSLLESGKEVLYAIYTIRTDVEYILSLQERIAQLEDENNQLKDRLVHLSY